MRTNRARRPTASRRPPSPRARAERLPLDARIFRIARAARGAHPTTSPSVPSARERDPRARSRVARRILSIFPRAPSRRVALVPRRTVQFTARRRPNERSSARIAKRTTADYRSIDRGKTRRARIPRPLSRGDERVSLVPLARRVRRSRPTPRRRALPRARGTAADPRARSSARGADGDRPTDPTDPTDRVGGRGWDGYVLGS